MPTLFTNAILLTPFERVEPGALAVSAEGKILYAGPAAGAPETGGESIDLGGSWLAPGFIDVHVHGGIGISFGEGDPAEEIRRYATWVTRTGVTGFLCSLAAPDGAALLALVRAYVEALEAWKSSAQPQGLAQPAGAEALGIHLEGPYLNPEKKGAFNPAWLRRPASEEVEALLEAGQGWIRQVTLAPELPGSEEAARRFRQAGVVAALGHTSAGYDLASAALAGNFKHVTHAFNAQSPFHHREPGVFGAVMASENATAELIADGVHVHPGAMKVLYRCLGSERVVLITDAMSAAGLPDGPYELVGNPVTVKNGQARLSDGTLAGSTAAMHACVWNMHTLVGVPLLETVRMASWNPARVFGLERRLGSLEPGKDANLVVLGKSGEVEMTVVKGKVQ
jgi:N-acetylglucosamine-6-phosphate deacetylase